MKRKRKKKNTIMIFIKSKSRYTDQYIESVNNFLIKKKKKWLIYLDKINTLYIINIIVCTPGCVVFFVRVKTCNCLAGCITSQMQHCKISFDFFKQKKKKNNTTRIVCVVVLTSQLHFTNDGQSIACDLLLQTAIQFFFFFCSIEHYSNTTRAV